MRLKETVLLSLLVVFAAAGCSDVDFVAVEAQPSVTANGDDDKLPPASLTINEGAASTRHANVKLQLEIPEVAKEIYLTDDSTCGADGSWAVPSSEKVYLLGTENAEASVYLKYRNEEGAESACVSDSILHDNIPPLMSMEIPSPLTQNTSVAIDFDAKDDNGIGYIECSLNGGPFEECDFDRDSVEILDSLGNQMYGIRIRAADTVGNISLPVGGEFLVDNIPPRIELLEKMPQVTPLEDAAFKFRTEDFGSGIQEAHCRYKGQLLDFAKCQAGIIEVPGTTGANHSISIEAYDKAKNKTVLTYAWVVNKNAPSVQITVLPDNPSNKENDVTRFVARDDVYGVKTTACELNGVSLNPCLNNTAIQLLALPEGLNTFKVVATNTVDLAGVDAYSWVVDTIAPVVNIVDGPAPVSANKSPTFNYTATDIGGTGIKTISCYLNDALKPCTVSGGQGSLNLPNLPVGAYKFQVRASDFAGNIGESSNYDFVVQEAIRYCNDPAYSTLTGDCIALRDSFERSNLNAADANNGFGWELAFYDCFGCSGAGLDAQILQKGFNPISIIKKEVDEGIDQRRGLWFRGRAGASVHELILLTKPMDLENFQALKFSYDFLPVDMEFADQFRAYGAVGYEGVRVEICTGTGAQCTAAPIRPANPSDGPVWPYWDVVPNTSSANNAGQGLNGLNHNSLDWKSSDVEIDLSGFSIQVRKNFRVRFRVLLTDGLLPGGLLEDAVAIDNVKAIAVQSQN